MSDRQLGYLLMAATLLLTAGVAIYVAITEHEPKHTRTLRFDEVGSLNVEDPIRMKGLLVGAISGFHHDEKGRVLVYTVSDSPIPIRTSSRVSVKVKGLMGERFIEITPGNPNDPLDERNIIDGKFEMGPSEAIIYMNQLHAKITELKDIMLWLRDGKDDGKRPFIVAFNDIVGTVDSLVYNILTGITGMEGGLNEGFRAAADIAVQSTDLVNAISVTVPELIETLNNIMVKIDDMIPKVQTAFAQIDTVMTKIDGNSFLWGDDAEKIQKSLKEIRKIMDDIREEGLPLNIKFRFF